MKHIRKFNENVDNRQNGFTIGDLKKMIEGLDDETPVLLVNPVGRGSNQFVGDNIEIGDVIVSDDGISYETVSLNYA